MIYPRTSANAWRSCSVLQFDGDPYAAIAGGRVVWIWTRNDHGPVPGLAVARAGRCGDGRPPPTARRSPDW